MEVKHFSQLIRQYNRIHTLGARESGRARSPLFDRVEEITAGAVGIGMKPLKPGVPLRALGYASLNTLVVRPKNYSLEDQERIIDDHVRSQGWSLVKIEKEAFSPVNRMSEAQARPLLNKLLNATQTKGYDVLVIARLDRMTREMSNLAHLLGCICDQQDRRFVSIAEGLDSITPIGRLAMEMIDIFAKWDQKRVADRTRTMIARKRALGEHVGHAPYGYAYQSGQLVALEREQSVVRLIHHMRERKTSYNQIAQTLNKWGIPAKRGGEWHRETVKGVWLRKLSPEEKIRTAQLQN